MKKLIISLLVFIGLAFMMSADDPNCPIPYNSGPRDVTQYYPEWYHAMRYAACTFWYWDAAGGFVITGQGDPDAYIVWFSAGEKYVKSWCFCDQTEGLSGVHTRYVTVTAP